MVTGSIADSLAISIAWRLSDPVDYSGTRGRSDGVTLHTAIADRDRVNIATWSSSIQSNITTAVWTLWLIHCRYVVVIQTSICLARLSLYYVVCLSYV